MMSFCKEWLLNLIFSENKWMNGIEYLIWITCYLELFNVVWSYIVGMMRRHALLYTY